MDWLSMPQQQPARSEQPLTPATAANGATSWAGFAPHLNPAMTTPPSTAVAVVCGDKDGTYDINVNKVFCNCTECVGNPEPSRFFSLSAFEIHGGRQAAKQPKRSIKIKEGGTTLLRWLELHLPPKPKRRSPLPGKAAQPATEVAPEAEHLHAFPDLDLLAAAAEELPPAAVPGTGGGVAGAGSGARLPRTRPVSELQGEAAPGPEASGASPIPLKHPQKQKQSRQHKRRFAKAVRRAGEGTTTEEEEEEEEEEADWDSSSEESEETADEEAATAGGSQSGEGLSGSEGGRWGDGEEDQAHGAGAWAGAAQRGQQQGRKRVRHHAALGPKARAAGQRVQEQGQQQQGQHRRHKLSRHSSGWEPPSGEWERQARLRNPVAPAGPAMDTAQGYGWEAGAEDQQLDVAAFLAAGEIPPTEPAPTAQAGTSGERLRDAAAFQARLEALVRQQQEWQQRQRLQQLLQRLQQLGGGAQGSGEMLSRDDATAGPPFLRPAAHQQLQQLLGQQVDAAASEAVPCLRALPVLKQEAEQDGAHPAAGDGQGDTAVGAAGNAPAVLQPPAGQGGERCLLESIAMIQDGSRLVGADLRLHWMDPGLRGAMPLLRHAHQVASQCGLRVDRLYLAGPTVELGVPVQLRLMHAGEVPSPDLHEDIMTFVDRL
ncbi:hypothetical protein N2152v2_010440 [Parachlorella kessleri]